MRVPLLIVIPLCFAVVGGVWWKETRHADFVTPPSPDELAGIKARVAGSLIPADRLEAPLPQPAATPPPPLVEEPRQNIDAGDLNAAPTLAEYKDLAEKGASHYTELAVMLEVEGEFQRALLAWERVLDFGSPNSAQASAAIASIARLRPTLPDWNPEPDTAVPIVLRASAGSKTVKELESILAACAEDLQKASAGILRVTSKITPGKSVKRGAANTHTVAVWLTGPDKNSQSTEVMSFTVAKNDPLELELKNTVFSLIKGHLATHAVRKIIPIPAGGSADGALNSHITRLDWQKLGSALNQSVENP